MVQLPASRWSCITILWASLASFAAITLCVASQVFIVVVVVVVVYFVMDSVQKLLDTACVLIEWDFSHSLIQLCVLQETINTLLEEMAAVPCSTADGAWEGAKEADLAEKSSGDIAWFQSWSYHVGRQSFEKLIALTIFCTYNVRHSSVFIILSQISVPTHLMPVSVCHFKLTGISCKNILACITQFTRTFDWI